MDSNNDELMDIVDIVDEEEDNQMEQPRYEETKMRRAHDNKRIDLRVGCKLSGCRKNYQEISIDISNNQ